MICSLDLKILLLLLVLIQFYVDYVDSIEVLKSFDITIKAMDSTGSSSSEEFGVEAEDVRIGLT